MNYLDLYSSFPDRTITSAWDAQLRYGRKNPWLNEALRRYGDELFARFAACYADLHALPRGARRFEESITGAHNKGSENGWEVQHSTR